MRTKEKVGPQADRSQASTYSTLEKTNAIGGKENGLPLTWELEAGMRGEG
jgi:hypothetical protein